ncbi:MAG: hypothetical protein ACFE8L_05860 [Candidatus Hodarchaeota archaeon]
MPPQNVIILNKRKVRADDYIIFSIIGIFIVQLLFFKLIALMSIIVFPMFTLFLYGIYKLFMCLLKKGKERVKDLIMGLFSIPFGLFILIIIFSQPNISRGFIIYFMAIPVMIIGFAGIIKGYLIDVYTTGYRILNIIIGIVTSIETTIAYITADILFYYHIPLLCALLLFNGMARIALYLSEYRISIIHIRNLVILKFLFQIISEVPIKVVSEDVSEFGENNFKS